MPLRNTTPKHDAWTECGVRILAALDEMTKLENYIKQCQHRLEVQRHKGMDAGRQLRQFANIPLTEKAAFNYKGRLIEVDCHGDVKEIPVRNL